MIITRSVQIDQVRNLGEDYGSFRVYIVTRGTNDVENRNLVRVFSFKEESECKDEIEKIIWSKKDAFENATKLAEAIRANDYQTTVVTKMVEL